MKITVGGYYLDIIDVRDEQQANWIAQNAPLGWLELREQGIRSDHWWLVNIVRDIGMFSIVVQADPSGASPHLLTYEETGQFVIGYGKHAAVIDADMFNISSNYNGKSSFYQFFSLRHLGITDTFIAWFEKRIVALSYTGEVIWDAPSKLIITDAVLTQNALEIRRWNKDRLIKLSLIDGHIL